jgi:hypothetical protein
MKASGARTKIQPLEYRKKVQMLEEAIRDKPNLSPAEYRARLDELVAMGIVKKNEKGEWTVTVTILHKTFKKLGLEEGQVCKLQ